MSTNVADLIQAGAKRRQPTTADIVSLASGESSSGATTRRKESKSATKKGGSSRSSSSRTRKAKPPCKYGPRGPDGYCPKKPKSSNPRRQTATNRTKVTARSSGAATEQAVQVLVNPKASKEQKAAALTKAGEATAQEVVSSTVKQAVRKAKASKVKQQIKQVATAVAPTLGATAVLTGVAVAGGAATSKLQKGRVSKQAQKMLADAIQRTPPGQRKQYTPAVRQALLAQYEQEIRRRNDILFTK